MANGLWEIIASFAYDLVVYGIIATLIVTVITEVLGTDLRYRVRRRKRRFVKWLRDLEVKITVTMKTSQLAVPAEEVSGTVEAMFKESGLNSGRKNSSFHFTLPRNGTVSEGELTILPVEAEVAETIQVRLNYPIRYRTFADNFIDLQDAVNQIQKMVRGHFPQSREFVTVIEFGELKGMFETVGFLASFGLESLSTAKGKTRIDLSRDRVTLYGSLNSEIKAVIQEIVAYYG